MVFLSKRLSLIVVICLTVLLAACGNAATPLPAAQGEQPAESAAPAGESAPSTDLGDKEIKLGYMAWTDCEAFTNIAANVLRAQGYDVQLIPADAGVVYQSLADKQVDAMLCSWQPGTHEDYITKYQGQIEEAAVNLEGARLGWAVPEYVDADSIEDLKGMASEFDGQIVGIDPGAGLMRLSAEALKEYGLDEYTLVESSDAAMTAALDKAIKENKPIVVTTWAPHIMWAKYPVKWLEDPRGVLGDAEHISTMVNPDLKTESPLAYELLSRMTIDPTTLAGVMLQVQEGTNPETAAQEFVTKNQETIKKWMGQ